MSNSMNFTGMTYQVRANDFEAAKEWYSIFFGRPPDILPHEGFADQLGFCEWELISGPTLWLQVAEGSPAVGSGPIRFGVDDIIAALDRLVPLLGPERPNVGQTPDGKVRFCTFEDPFGNRIGFYEEINHSSQD